MKKLLHVILLLLFENIGIAQTPLTLNIRYAGALHTDAYSYLSTVTNLTLTGTIDARDFKCIRDEMTNLSVLDISGVKIASYTGNAATNGSTSIITYPSNTLPEYAFYDQNKQKGKTTLKSIILPSSINTIGQKAFLGCTGLTSVIVPSSINSIEYAAFADCSKLLLINLPNGLNSIGVNAFNNCSALITVDGDNFYYSSIGGVLYNKAQTTLIQCPTSITGIYNIPSTVKTIADYAFFASNLTSVNIPLSVSTIGTGGFTGSKITSLIIPTSVINIGANAFSNCKNIKQIIIPPSISIIRNSTFTSCSSLISITIPSSVTSIESSAFQNCSGLISIYEYSNSPINLSSVTNVFTNIDKTKCTLYVPVGSKSSYRSAYQWKDFQNIVETYNTAVGELPTPKFKFQVTGKTIVLSNVEGKLLSMFDAMGRKVYEKLNPGNSEQIALDKPGVYIIALDGYCTKVPVR